MFGTLLSMVTANLSLDSALNLRRGSTMPLFGLGTWLAEGSAATDAIKEALNYGCVCAT